MLNYEIIEAVSQKTKKPYTLLRMTFLLKGGRKYVLDRFLTDAEQICLQFLADPDEISAYLAKDNPSY